LGSARDLLEDSKGLLCSNRGANGRLEQCPIGLITLPANRGARTGFPSPFTISNNQGLAICWEKPLTDENRYILEGLCIGHSPSWWGRSARRGKIKLCMRSFSFYGEYRGNGLIKIRVKSGGG